MKRTVTFQAVERPDCGAQFERRVGACGPLPALCGPCSRTHTNGTETYRQEVAVAIVLRELLLVRR